VRLDVFLHRVCVLKSRSLAKEACDRGKVALNGGAAKGSRTVTAGDRIRLDLGVRILDLEVTAVPEGTVSKKEAGHYYRVLAEERPPL
jgi:ribosomal 50S subunit-recycling heat shock protein